MTKFTAFILIVALRIMYHPSPAANNSSPFASPSAIRASTMPAPGKGTASKMILMPETGNHNWYDEYFASPRVYYCITATGKNNKG